MERKSRCRGNVLLNCVHLCSTCSGQHLLCHSGGIDKFVMGVFWRITGGSTRRESLSQASGI